MSAEQRLWEVDCLIFVRAVATVWWRKEEKAEGFVGVFINGGILATGTRWPLLERRTAKMPAKQRLRKILAGSFRRRQPLFGGERRRRRKDFCRYVLKEASCRFGPPNQKRTFLEGYLA